MNSAPRKMLAVLVALVFMFALLGLSAILSPGRRPAPEPPRRVALPQSIQKSEVIVEPQKTSAADPGAAEVAIAAASPSALDAFEAWADAFIASSGEKRDTLQAEGVRLARTRRAAMQELIQDDPETALKRAVPLVRQRALPQAVREHLEEQISAEGRFGTVVTMPLNEDQPVEQKRMINVGEKMYRAFTYGRRNDTRIDNKIVPIHGIAIDHVMAVSEMPVRRIEPGEFDAVALQAARATSQCPVSGIPSKDNPDASPVLVGSRLVYLCHDGHIEAAAEDLLNEEAAGEPEVAQSAWTEGAKTLLYIPVYFKDQTAGPSLTNMAAVSTYMQDCSFGKTSITTTFTPAYQLSKNAADYADEYTLYTEARNIAKANGFDYLAYNLDCVRYSGGPGSFGGQAYVGARGCWLKSNSSGTAAHEFGHNYGLWHANYWSTTDGTTIGSGSNQEYGNIFDVMGGSGSFSKGHFNAYEKNKLNWIPTTNTTAVTASGTHRIYAHDLLTLTGSNKYGLKIQKDSDRDYWIEYRQNSGWSTNAWIMNGVVLNWDPWASSNRGSQLLDTTPGSADGKNDSPIVIGRTFSDTAAGIHFTLTNRGGTSPNLWADVVVNIGAFTGNQAPTLALSASNTGPATSEIVTFTATANDPNGDTLAYHWDFGDKTFGPNSTTSTKAWSTTGTKTVTCIVSDMKGGTATKTITVTVGTSSKPTVTIAASDATATEAAGNPGQFKITMSASAATATTVNFTVSGTAASGSDFTPLGTSVSIPAGATSATLPVSTLEDALVEGSETVVVTLGASTSYNVGSPNNATVTISDNDSPPAATKLAFSVQPANTAQGATITPAVKVALQDAGGATVTTATNAVTLAIGANPNSGTLSGTLTVNAVNGVATFSNLSINKPGSGYTLTASATGLTGATSNAFNITAAAGNGDGLAGIYYDNMDFTGTAVSRIDPAINFNWGSGAPHASIGADTFTTRWTGKVLAQYTETYTFYANTDDGVRLWVNNVLLVDKWQNQAPTEYSGTIALASGTQYDIKMEYFENGGGAVAQLSWSSASTPKAIIPQSQLYSGGLPPTVAFSAATSSGNETATSVNLAVALAAGTQSTQTVTVDYAVTGGTATGGGTDYTLANGTLTFTPGQTAKNIAVTVVNDTLNEPSETIQVTLRNPAYATLGTNAVHTYTISNDDPLPTVAFAAAASNVGEAGAAAALSVALNTQSAQTVTVDYAVTGGSATGGGTDYTLAGGTLTFAPGQTTQAIDISINNDALPEANETIQVALSNPGNAALGTNAVQTCTIDDDDPKPTVAFTTTLANGSESVSPANLEVSLSAVSGQTVTVNYAVSGGSATGGGNDYTLASGTLSFSAGQTTRNISIVIVNDAVSESNETIQVTLSGAGNATLGANTVHTYTINNDDNVAPVAANATFTTNKNVAVSGTLSASDAENSTLTFSIVANGSLGSAVITDPLTGAFTYTPNTGARGTDTFTFKANDGEADSNTATVTVKILNKKPVASSTQIWTSSTTAADGTLAASDPDGDPLTYTVVSGGTLGAFTLDPATGQYTYQPSGAEGQDVITFEVNDGTDSASATLLVNVSLALEITSGPTASEPRIAGTPIQFGCAANASLLFWTWDFGDGSTANGENVSHTYAAGGTYVVTVTAQKLNAEAASASLTLNVASGGGGGLPTIDTDGDGTSDADEITQGTNPLDLNSRPGGTGDFDGDGIPDDQDIDDDNDGVMDVNEAAMGTNAFNSASMQKLPMTLSKLSMSVKFNTQGKDVCMVSGTIPNVPALFKPGGAAIKLDVGGAQAVFTLDAKGRAKNSGGSFQISLKPSKRNKTSKAIEFLGGPVVFKAKIAGNFAPLWQDEGIDRAVSEKNAAHSVIVDLYFNGNVYTHTTSGKYTGVAGKGGRLKK